MDRGVLNREYGQAVVHGVVKRRLIHLRQDSDEQALIDKRRGARWIGPRITRIVNGHTPHWEASVSVDVVVNCKPHLLEIVPALHPPRGLTGVLDRRQQQSDEEAKATLAAR
jgi:hypothetical protein